MLIPKAVLTFAQAKDETSKETPGGRVPSDGCNSEFGVNTSDHDAKNTTGAQLGKDLDENAHDHSVATEETPDPRKSQQSLLSSRTKSPTLAKEDASQGHDIGIESPIPNPTPSSETRGTPDPRGQPKEKDKDPGKRKPAGPNEPFEQWERDEMEALLKEVQGHLGESPSGILKQWVPHCAYQLSFRHDSWRARISPITSCLMPIGTTLFPGHKSKLILLIDCFLFLSLIEISYATFLDTVSALYTLPGQPQEQRRHASHYIIAIIAVSKRSHMHRQLSLAASIHSILCPHFEDHGPQTSIHALTPLIISENARKGN